MAFKPDEVHVKEFSRKLKLLVTILCIVAILLLVYLVVYSFFNLHPLITIALFIATLVVVGIIIFVMDIGLYREVS